MDISWNYNSLGIKKLIVDQMLHQYLTNTLSYFTVQTFLKIPFQYKLQKMVQLMLMVHYLLEGDVKSLIY